MVSAYWVKVIDDDHSVPTDRPLADLTAELTQMLGSGTAATRLKAAELLNESGRIASTQGGM